MKKLLWCLLCATSVCIANPSTQFNQFVKQEMKKYQIPGASIAVMKQGNIDWAKGYGFADVEQKRKVTPHTLFQACSITKPFTSIAVLSLLYQRGLSINLPVNSLLTDWKIPDNQFTKQQAVTVAMLLNHSAGITTNTMGLYGPKETLPTLQQLLNGEKPAKQSAISIARLPGEKMQYSGAGYAILQLLLENLSGQPYDQYMTQHILKPLQLQHSFFDLELANEKPDQIAWPYDQNGKRYPDGPRRNISLAVGDLWSTPTDLLHFAHDFQQALRGKKIKMITPVLAKAMIEPSSTATRGLGFYITDKYGNEKVDGDYFSHGGFNEGYLAILVASQREGDGVAVMINLSPSFDSKEVPQYQFIRDVVRKIADENDWQ